MASLKYFLYVSDTMFKGKFLVNFFLIIGRRKTFISSYLIFIDWIKLYRNKSRYFSKGLQVIDIRTVFRSCRCFPPEKQASFSERKKNICILVFSSLFYLLQWQLYIHHSQVNKYILFRIFVRKQFLIKYNPKRDTTYIWKTNFW